MGAMSDLEQRLRAMASDFYDVNGPTMKKWDEIRAICAKRDGGDLPRLMFEQIIEDAADLLIEASEALAGVTPWRRQ